MHGRHSADINYESSCSNSMIKDNGKEGAAAQMSNCLYATAVVIEFVTRPWH